jgi:predicted amidohydrolase YtcJ
MKTLYRASRVHTLSHPAQGEWLLVDGRHVERVGTGEPPLAERTVELPGTTIIPGFIDGHVHLTGTGINHSGPALSEARSAEDLLRLAVEGAEPGEPLLVHGYDETSWTTRDLPSLETLDKASESPLIIVRADGHISLANRAALHESGVLDLTGVEHDESGEPTGVVRQEANNKLQEWFHKGLSDHRIQQFQLEAAALAASRGVTCVHEMAIPALRGMRDVEVLLEQKNRLPVDVVPYIASKDIPLIMDLGLSRIGGDLSLDGSIGARTALLADPYTDGDGSGARYQDDDELAEFLHNAHLAGLQVGMHAIGDEAIEQALSAWERVYRSLDSRERRHFRARRHRIEHFELATADHIERAAMLGMAISVQPAFDAQWGHPGGMYELRLGEGRAMRMNPFRTLLLRGMEVGAGSDSPVTSLDPLHGIRALESHHDPAQRMSREEAVRLFTWGGARIAHLDEKKGRLEPGMQADFAAYEGDPLIAVETDDLRPVLTVSLGREVFAA